MDTKSTDSGYIGKSVPRANAKRLLQGRGAYVDDLRLAFLGVGAAPALARGVMAAMEGKRASADAIAAATQALVQDLEPSADLYSSAATKMQLARVLTGRALAALAA